MPFITVAVFICLNEIFQNLAFGAEPIVQSGVLVRASCEPKFVCALLDLQLNLQVVSHRENGDLASDLLHVPAL